MEESLDRVLGERWDRRTALKLGALMVGGVATAALVGCGGDDDDDSGPAGTTATATQAASDVDLGDDERGHYVRDDSLPFPYNFPEPKTEPKSGGVMRVAATWDVGPMDPTVSAAGGTVTVPNMSYNRLIGFVRGPKADPFEAKLQPELAASWERSPDGMTYTFKIDPRAKWQNLAPLNGRKFVAADAKFALERYSKEGVHTAYYVNVDGFEAVDENTLRVKMKRPVADFLNPLASNKQTIFPHELVDNGEITKKVVGTGPMILKEAVPASNVTFDRNPDYWRKPVLLDGFEFRIMPDTSARLAALRSGQVEYAYSPISSLSELQQLLKTNPDMDVNVIPLTYITFTVAMNLSDPKYQDERVRRAISLATNRQELIALVSEQLGKALHIIPWTFVFDNEPTLESGQLGKWMRYAPDEAKQLLQAAGHEQMTVNNIFYAYSSANDRTAEVLAPQWRQVGITIAGGKTDYTQFNSQWVGGKISDISTSAWGTSGYDADNWFYGQVYSKSGGNRWRINDAQIDQWAEEQQVQLDPAKRREIQRKIWDRDLDLMYRPALPNGFGFEAYQPWMRGIRFGSDLKDSSSYYTWGAQVENAWLDK
ncbi:MAG: ABC transporter substrate-binding protein [Dehalococcoidia bacterium]